jgi:hypothetical protein
MKTLRTWALVAAVCGLCVVGAAAEDPKAPGADKDKKVEQKDKDKAKDKAKAKAEPPRMRYEHTTQAGRKGTFTLEGPGGTADYYFNGEQHKDKLTYVRSAKMSAGAPGQPGLEGWVYQVERDGKKAPTPTPLWFLFGSTAIKNRQGETVYPMFYTTTPPAPDGKQPWTHLHRPRHQGDQARHEVTGAAAVS